MTVLLVVLAATTAAGLLWKAVDGRVRTVADPRDRSEVLAALGAEAGERATLLQFSSAFCAPCRSTRTLLGSIADAEPGVRHVEVDAESHLELVRELGVLKTPTTLVLDGAGLEIVRAAGLPRREDVVRALPGALGSAA